MVTSGKGKDEEESGDEARGAGCSWIEKGVIHRVNGLGLHSTRESEDLD